MRRLLTTVCVVVLVDTVLYSVLTPLLPEIADDLGLAKGTAGLLVAAYAAGSFAGAVPAGLLATRLGPKRAVLTGLTVMVAASLVFATASSLEALMTARFLQGMSSSISWSGAIAWLLAAAPRARRGELLGVALGSGIFGAVFGPVLGSVAALTSREAVFSGLAGLALVAAVWSMRLHDAHVHEPAPGSLRRALRHPTFLAGLGLMALPALLLGIVLVLGPLHLAARGFGAAAIGAVWLVGAVVQASASPLLGRMSDRHGAARPVMLLLAVSACLSVVLALLGAPVAYAIVLLATSTAYGALFAPAFALIAHGAEACGLAQGLAFACMNAAWSVGAVIGPSAGGALAELAGDRVPLLVAAGICSATLVVAARRPRSSPAVAAR